MANSLLTPSIIAKEALFQLENNLVMGKNVHREYKKEFVKVGGTVSIRKPVKFTTTKSATLSKQDVTEGSTSITVGTQAHVGWEFSSSDLTLTVDQYSERYIEPAMITLANTIDKDLFALYKDVWNFVGTPGSTPDSYADIALAAQRLDEMAVPETDRCLMLNPSAHWSVAGAASALQAPNLVMGAWEKGRIRDQIAMMRPYSSQNVQTHTVGTKAGTPLVNGASQTSTYANVKTTNAQDIITDGWTASSAVLKEGDVITIAGVYAVNPVPHDATKSAMPYLQEFVVNEDVTADGSGNATFSISPAIITSGAYQTVSAAPADNAEITVKGTASTGYPQNLAFHKNAFALVTCPLIMPDGAAFKARASHNGLSVRVIKDYDITNDTEIIRLDVLYGVQTIYPDLAVRLTG